MRERLSLHEQPFKNEALKTAIDQGMADYERLSQGEEIATPKLVIEGKIVELDWKPIPDKEKYYSRYFQFLIRLRWPYYVRIKSAGEHLLLSLEDSDLPSIKAQLAGFGLKALEEGDFRIGFKACNLAGVLNTEEVGESLEKLEEEIESQAPDLTRKLIAMKIIRRERFIKKRQKEKGEERVFYPKGYIELLCDFSPVMFDRVKSVALGRPEIVLLFETIDKIIGEATSHHTLIPLRERNKMIIRDLYALDDGKPKTEEEIGRRFRLSSKRIKQIKSRFLLNLRFQPRFRREILSFFENRVPLESLPSELSRSSRT